MFGFGKSRADGLLVAAADGDAIKVREVLSNHLDLTNSPVTKNLLKEHPEYEEGSTALHLAAAGGHVRIVELLLSLKASVNARTATSRTPLHVAAASKRDSVLEHLLDHNATVDAIDAEGRTALHLAAYSGHLQSISHLLSHGASVRATDNDGNTPLHMATRAGSKAATLALLSAGAQLEAANRAGHTPLHAAVIGLDHTLRGQYAANAVHHREAAVETVRTLIAKGAQINAIDNAGETVLDLLTYLDGASSSDTMVALLRESGAECRRYRHREDDNTNRASRSGVRPNKASSASSTTIPGIPPSPGAESTPAPAGASTASTLLGPTPVVIGRDPSCQVHFRSRTLSRRHAVIELAGTGFSIRDLGSHNGTHINGTVITETRMLNDGDVITLGLYEFKIEGRKLIPLHGELPEATLAAERAALAAEKAAH